MVACKCWNGEDQAKHKYKKYDPDGCMNRGFSFLFEKGYHFDDQ